MDRDKLVRECFGLFNRIGFREFDAKNMAEPAVVRQWPDATMRARAVKAHWDDATKERLAGFRELVSRMSHGQLLVFRGDLLSELARSPSLDERATGMARVAANDNHGRRRR
jgi:hypothetical protein